VQVRKSADNGERAVCASFGNCRFCGCYGR